MCLKIKIQFRAARAGLWPMGVVYQICESLQWLPNDPFWNRFTIFLKLDFEKSNRRILFRAIYLVYTCSSVKFDRTDLEIYSVKVPSFIKTFKQLRHPFFLHHFLLLNHSICCKIHIYFGFIYFLDFFPLQFLFHTNACIHRSDFKK